LLTLVLVAILFTAGLAWFLHAIERLTFWEMLQKLCDISFVTLFIYAVVGIIGILPLICFLESCKFSLIPLLMFSPLSALHFQNSRFFYALFAWLDVNHADAAQFCARVQSTATVFATRFRSLATATARQRHEAASKLRIRELFVDLQRHLAAHPPPPAVAHQPPLAVVHLLRAHGSVFAPAAAAAAAGAEGAVAVPRTAEGAAFVEQVMRLEAAPVAAEMKAQLDARELRLLDEASRVLHIDAANLAAAAAAAGSSSASAPAFLTEESAAETFSWAALLDAHRMTASHMWSSYLAFVRVYMMRVVDIELLVANATDIDAEHAPRTLDQFAFGDLFAAICLHQRVRVVALIMLMHVFFPMLVVGSLYSCIYPFLSIWNAVSFESSTLPLALTAVYGFALLTVCALYPLCSRFLHCSLVLHAYFLPFADGVSGADAAKRPLAARDAGLEWVQHVRRYHATRFLRPRQIETLQECGMPADVARLVGAYLPSAASLLEQRPVPPHAVARVRAAQQ
jgi:hypothetical protein